MERISSKDVQTFEKEHVKFVRKSAAECTILLKKDGSFPLEQPGKIALFGSGARRSIKGGTGSGDVNVRHFTNIEEGLVKAGFEITSGEWLDQYDRIVQEARKDFVQKVKEKAKAAGVSALTLGMGKVMPEPEYELPLDADGDTAVYVLARNSGEGSDRLAEPGDIFLTETEKRDILALNKKYSRFLLALNTGGMVDLSPVQNVKNILLLGQLGIPTGDVFADLLLGKSYPSGKLAMTWTDLNAYPSTEGFGDPDDTVYREGIYVGYRYFDTAGEKVSYPFGYGLGFTDFELSCLSFRGNETTIAVDVKVKNIGNYPGKEVVQVYYSAPQGKLGRPYQELAAFAKTKTLQPGEEAITTVTFSVSDMSAYDAKRASYILEGGEYVIRVGNSSRTTHIAGILRLKEEAVIRKLKNICQRSSVADKAPALCPFTYPGEAEEMEQAPVIEISAVPTTQRDPVYSEMPVPLKTKQACQWSEVKSGAKSVEDFAGGLTEEELVGLCIGNYSEGTNSISAIGAAGHAVPGSAGETTGKLSDLGLDTLVMADGPAGIRVIPSYRIVNGTIKALASPFGEDWMQFCEQEGLEQMAAKPTAEEANAPVYYQYATAIPIGTDLAQTWNLEIAQQYGDLVGDEMERFGIQLWLAPALNIQRSPLCGRNFEYYSEDPLISGKIAAAVTRGVQKHKGRGTTIKHFACNNQETNRYASNSIVSERALREIYLRGFEICVTESQPHALMTSYNLINGEHSCNRKDLLTDVLRDEWGFKGIVMTDWDVTRSGMSRPGSKHPAGSAAGCVKAGNDLTMPGRPEDKADMMKALCEEGHPYPLTRAELETCAVRILKMILTLEDC